MSGSDRFDIGDILVVGDWFVDEYWFVVRHHSEISSHTRPVHYRIISKPDEIVRDFCGGGLITRVLYELRKYRITNGDKTNAINSIKSYGTIYENYKNQIDRIVQGGFRLQEVNEVLAELKKTVDNNLLIIDPEFIIASDHDKKTYEKTEKQYQLFGLGRWHPNDDKFLPHFIHARCRTEGTVGNALFSIKLDDSFCKGNIDAELINLESEREPSNASTIRCIRAYRFVKGRFEQLHRIDWEQAPPCFISKENQEKFFSERNKADKDVVNGLFANANGKNKITNLTAVIIDDHIKGVINEDLIESIKDKAKPKWFIRTKDNRIRQAETWPDWLRKIDSIELLIVGPEISCRSYPSNRLLTDKDCLTKHAYELIDMLVKEEDLNRRTVKNVVLTSDNLEVVVLWGDFCFIANPRGKIENIELEKINWTTAFFAAFVYEILNLPEDKNKDKSECKIMIERAIENAHAHCGVRIPKVVQMPIDESCQNVSFDSVSRSSKQITTSAEQVCDWPKMRKDWKDASSGIGMILAEKQVVGATITTIKRLDIWRSSTDLPGYIVCIKEKREAIQRIWQKINTFILCEQPSQSLSILLEAEPAVGKSFLVKTLAEISNCTLEQYDITQMIERSELLDLFDKVADAQARSSRPVFVFVDEINATLGGSPVYGAFLSPLESGTYIRNGQRIELKPCVWMFAGTPDGDSCNDDSRNDDKDQKKEKRKDFESRMTMIEHIDYNSMIKKLTDARITDLNHEARLEQVYLGVKRINDAFNDVNRIDHDILKVFYQLEPKKAPARHIKKLATSLENVQYGRVHKGNCTSLEWQKVIDKIIQQDDRPKWREAFNAANVEYVDINLN